MEAISKHLVWNCSKTDSSMQPLKSWNVLILTALCLFHFPSTLHPQPSTLFQELLHHAQDLRRLEGLDDPTGRSGRLALLLF